MLKFIILGVIQGLTEFLPVSSSGHLVIFQKFFGMAGEEVAVSVILHLGTMLALFIFFAKDIRGMLRNGKWVVYIAVVTVITGMIGLSGKDFFERLFTSTRYVGFSLLVTGAILLLTRRIGLGRRDLIDIKDAAVLGVAQGIAIIPGISRSGITLATLLFRKIDRQTAFTFSFLASIPAITGAAILEAKDIGNAWQNNMGGLSVGFIVSCLVGLLALAILKNVVLKARLHYFGYYCLVAGLVTLIFLK